MLLAQLMALMFNIHRPAEAEPMTLEELLPGIDGPSPDAPPAAPATHADARLFCPDLERS